MGCGLHETGSVNLAINKDKYRGDLPFPFGKLRVRVRMTTKDKAQDDDERISLQNRE